MLRLIQRLYGPHNAEAECFFPDYGVAIFVKDFNGSMPIYVNLTVVSMIAEEENLSDEELLADWLRPR